MLNGHYMGNKLSSFSSSESLAAPNDGSFCERETTRQHTNGETVGTHVNRVISLHLTLAKGLKLCTLTPRKNLLKATVELYSWMKLRLYSQILVLPLIVRDSLTYSTTVLGLLRQTKSQPSAERFPNSR